MLDKIGFIVIILICSHSQYSSTEEFDIDPEKILESRLMGSIYNVKNKKRPVNIFEMVMVPESNSSLTTTPRPIKMPDKNTIEKIKYRMKMRELKQIMTGGQDSRIDLSKPIDDPEPLTRRFDMIVRKNNIKTPEIGNGDYRRHNYMYYEYWEGQFKITKNILIELLQSFVYRARYFFPYMQKLRLKYNHERRYKIGYCIAMLKHFKQQQMMLYAVVTAYRRDFTTMHVYIHMYEKTLRLDRDIKDIKNLLRKLHKEQLSIDEEKRKSEPSIF